MKFLNTNIFFLFLVIAISCNKATNIANNKQTEEELIDPSSLNPADIAAYDREECLPFIGLSLQNSDIKAISKSNDTILLQNLLNTDPLFVRYSQYACGDCTKFLNHHLITYKDSTPDARIVFLLKDVEMRDLHVIRSKFGNRFEIYKVDSIPSDFDEAHTPYLFKTDEQLCIQNMYIPRKELPDSLYAYFKTLGS